MVKSGFSGDEIPQSLIANHLNTSKQRAKGVLALDSLSIDYPIENGKVKNWDDLEKVLTLIYEKELNVSPSEHPVVLTEPVLNEKGDREKLTELMFEKYHVPSFYLAYSSVLSLFAAGHQEGVSVNIGHGLLEIVPVHNGFAVPSAATKLNLAGYELVDWLQKILKENSSLTILNEKEAIYEIKEKHCYVAQNFDAELQKLRETPDDDATVKLNNNESIKLKEERIRCPELLFKPDMNGLNCNSIHKEIVDTIKKCDEGIQKRLYSSIVVSGGSSLFDGLQKRLESELTKIAPEGTNIKVFSREGREYGSWVGGSTLACLNAFTPMLINQDEYKNEGPAVVHRKCK